MDKDFHSELYAQALAFSERKSYAEKQANDFRWAEVRGDALDLANPDVDPNYVKMVEDNYRLMEGDAMIHYKKAAKRLAENPNDMFNEGLDMPDMEMEHFDVVYHMIEGLTGDQQRKKWNVMVTDSSRYTQNYIKDQRNTLLSNHFNKNLIEPARQAAFLQWQQEHDVRNIFQLSPEERQQMQADVNSRVESLVPKDIMMFLKHGAKGKIEEQGQALAQAIITKLELKFLCDQAYKHSFANDGMVFYSGVRRNKPFVEWVDLTTFNTGGTNNLFIDYNPWFKKVRTRHPSVLLNEYGEEFNRTEKKRFDEMVNGRGGGTDSDRKDREFLTNLDDKSKLLLPNFNLLKAKDQLAYQKFQESIRGQNYNEMDNIREAHLVWASQCKMKYVTRGFKDGSIRGEWFTEDYEFNPANGDLKEEIGWPNEYWEVTKIGETDPIFVNKRPVPFQFRDITDPFESRSPYTGAYFGDLMGKGTRRTPLHIAKSYIHGVNFQMKVIKDREASDIGKVMLMTIAAKPEGWTWGKFIEVIRATRLVPLNLNKAGLTAADVQFFREIDLSSMYDILPRINYLQYQISQIANILGYNAARQGTQAASTSVGNNQSNLSRAFSQTHNRAEFYNKVVEHLVENQIYYTKSAVRNGNIYYRYVLDDLSIANIDIDIEEIDDANFGIRVSMDDGNAQELDISKNYVLPYLQNNQLGPLIAMQTIQALSKGELLSIASEAELEVQMKQAQAMDFQTQSAEQQAQMQKDMMELKVRLDMMRDVPNNEAKKEMAAINSLTIANANDINRDNENDYLQSAELEREFKREKLYIDDAREREIKAAELGLEQDALALENIWQLEGIKAMKERKTEKPSKK